MVGNASPMAGALRVLVVDDDRDTADSMAMLLRFAKHEARACYSGADCLACLDEFRPHVVFLDLAMPDMDGFEVVTYMPNTVVIALTGYGQAADVQMTQEAGFAAHLLKPVTFDRLLETIAQHVTVTAD